MGAGTHFIKELFAELKNDIGISQRGSPRGRLWPRGHILKSLASAS